MAIHSRHTAGWAKVDSVIFKTMLQHWSSTPDNSMTRHKNSRWALAFSIFYVTRGCVWIWVRKHELCLPEWYNMGSDIFPCTSNVVVMYNVHIMQKVSMFVSWGYHNGTAVNTWWHVLFSTGLSRMDDLASSTPPSSMHRSIIHSLADA